jgi:hypothetical protein
MSKVIIPVSPIGILEIYGYYSLDPVRKRRRALNNAIKHHAYKDIISRLNAVAIRFKNRKPEITKNIREDMAYMKKKYRPEKKKSKEKEQRIK